MRWDSNILWNIQRITNDKDIIQNLNAQRLIEQRFKNRAPIPAHESIYKKTLANCLARENLIKDR